MPSCPALTKCMASEEALQVEVVYALAQEQVVAALCVPPGTTVRDAISLSGLAARFAALEAGMGSVGIHGRVVAADTALRDGDRVEIYRPLVADPKQARRRRAAEKPR